MIINIGPLVGKHTDVSVNTVSDFGRGSGTYYYNSNMHVICANVYKHDTLYAIRSESSLISPSLSRFLSHTPFSSIRFPYNPRRPRLPVKLRAQWIYTVVSKNTNE